MRIATTELNKEKFLEDFGYYYRKGRLENEYGEIDHYFEDLSKTIDQVNNDIVTFLKVVDNIDELKIQKCCRKAAIVQMYDVGVSDRKPRHCYYVAGCTKDVVLLQHYTSYSHDDHSVFISKYGEVKVGAERIWVNERGNYGYGWFARAIVDGTVSQRVGFYSNAGDVVLPCGLFQSIIPGNINCVVKYDSLKFDLRVYGNILELGDEAKDIKEPFRGGLFISPEQVLFSLSPINRSKEDDDMVEVEPGITVSRHYAISRGLIDPSKTEPSEQESLERLKRDFEDFRVLKYCHQ